MLICVEKDKVMRGFRVVRGPFIVLFLDKDDKTLYACIRSVKLAQKSRKLRKLFGFVRIGQLSIEVLYDFGEDLEYLPYEDYCDEIGDFLHVVPSSIWTAMQAAELDTERCNAYAQLAAWACANEIVLRCASVSENSESSDE